jgi:hypothetical protein
VRQRKSGPVQGTDPETEEKRELIEHACRLAEQYGVPLWCQDEAGPYQAIPPPGAGWAPQGEPIRQQHEYVRGGTAKLLTLFRPARGEVRAKGVTSAPNAVLHPWLKEELGHILSTPEHTPCGCSHRHVGPVYPLLVAAAARVGRALQRSAAPPDPDLG